MDTDTFTDKKQQLSKYFSGYFNLKINRHIEKLTNWEKKFKFDSKEFYKQFTLYVKYLNKNKKKEINKFKNFKIGLRINGEHNKIYTFLFTLKNRKILFNITKTINELYVDTHLVLQVNGNLIKMALDGVYTFEDLVNCSYIIDRFNKDYTKEETYFWRILSEFNWFLKNLNIKQKNKSLLQYQMSFNNLKI